MMIYHFKRGKEMSLKGDQYFRRSLDLPDQLQSISKGYNNANAIKCLEDAKTSIMQAIKLEYKVCPEIAEILKDEILGL